MMARDNKPDTQNRLRIRLYEIIFEADTREGKWFDVALIVSIIMSVLVVMLDSMRSVSAIYGSTLNALEWFFTILFTVEYIFRLNCVRNPGLYARSFFGVVDLMSIIPTYLSVVFPGSEYLLVIRVIRILRVFRILKLVKFMSEASVLMRAMKASRHKITVFLFAVMTLVIVFGSLMYLIEGEENGFTSIPRSVYWAIVTMTTVGYGDISPKTNIGQMLAAIIMITGYSIIAVPTGIVTTELAHAVRQKMGCVCSSCSSTEHSQDALFCKDCGERLPH